MMVRKIIVSALLLISVSVLFAQDYNKIFLNGKELFQNKQYGSAQVEFLEILEAPDAGQTLVDESHYYNILCSYYLYQKNTISLCVEYLNNADLNLNTGNVKFILGTTYFRSKDYNSAFKYYDMVSASAINKNYRHEFNFKKGFSAYKNQKYDKAILAFKNERKSDSEYASDAQYYYAHSMYIKKKFQASLKAFKKLLDDDKYSTRIPYFFTNIYYQQHKYHVLIKYATPIFESSKDVENKSDIARLLALSHYNQKEYKKALKYFNFYKKNAPKLKKQTIYQMAYSYYMMEDFNKSVSLFQQISSDESLLSQNANYLMANSYIRLKKFKEAITPFSIASKMDFDPEIKRDALFNHARLLYKLSYSPLGNIVNIFNKFIELYPNTEQAEYIRKYLVKAYLNSKNYKMAYESINKLQNKSNDLMSAYQKICFYRAVELFKAESYTEAITMFDKSLERTFPENNMIKSQSYQWLGESYYKLENYSKAAENFMLFYSSPDAVSTQGYENACYNIGYSYYKMKEYSKAIEWLNKFIVTSPNNVKLLGDAYTRTADCYFVLNNYNRAIKFYDNVTNLKDYHETDYAYYKKGLSYGLVKQHNEKIRALKTLISDYSESIYSDDAKFELAKTYHSKQLLDYAIQVYNELLNDHPFSKWVNDARLRLGLIYYNKSNNKEALKYYKQVIEHKASNEDIKKALTGIKNIYIEENKVDDYVAYHKKVIGSETISNSEQDSLSFVAAERIYFRSDFKHAIEALSTYIEKYPKGAFVLKSYFYRAVCNMNEDRITYAKDDYEYVTTIPNNIYLEEAHENLAKIYYKDQKFEKALENYEKLKLYAESTDKLTEADMGIFNCHYELEQYDKAVIIGEHMLASYIIKGVARQELIFNIGNSLDMKNNVDSAIHYYKMVDSTFQSEHGAEAQYNIARILFEEGKADESEKAIGDFINANSPQQYWLARSFILWSDIYVKRKNFYQAKSTLKSVIDNYGDKEDNIIPLATDMLKKVEDLTKEKEKAVFESDSAKVDSVDKDTDVGDIDF